MELQGCYMAVKNAQKSTESNTKISTPVFMDGSSLTIPQLSVLQADGSLVAGAKVPDLSRELAIKIYSDMVYIRTLDERMVRAQRQGRLSFYLTCTGEEASVAGTIAAFSKDDMVMGQYREQVALRFRGFTTKQFMNQLFSNVDDLGKGTDAGSLRLSGTEIYDYPLTAGNPNTPGCRLCLRPKAGGKQCLHSLLFRRWRGLGRRLPRRT